MWFETYETVIVNQNAAKGLPNNVGDLAVVIGHREKSNYDYNIEFANGTKAFIKESELNKLTDEQKELAEYIFFGNKVLHKSNEVVKIIKVDYINNQAEVEFVSGGTDVVSFDSLKEIEKENISVEEKLDAYETFLEIFFNHYKNENDTYTLPKHLLINLIKESIDLE